MTYQPIRLLMKYLPQVTQSGLIFMQTMKLFFFQTGWIVDTYGPDVLASKPIDLQNFAPTSSSIKGTAIKENGDILFSILRSGAPYIISTDGNQELSSNSYLGAVRKHLRLNKNEDAFWGSSDVNKVYVHNLSEDFIGLPTHYTNSKFGVPTTIEEGYLVASFASEIYLPGSSTKVAVPMNSIITSIDF